MEINDVSISLRTSQCCTAIRNPVDLESLLNHRLDFSFQEVRAPIRDFQR